MTMTPDPARAAHWALALTEMPSVTGSEDEAAFATKLAAMLRASPAFADAPDSVWTIPAEGREGRACVGGLVRGTGRRTMVLTGHFDTVQTGDYGPLQPLAIAPDALKAALLEHLDPEDGSEAEKLAHADLSGPDFLPGRGLLDMKSGLAAGLAVAEAFAADPERDGNLLFLAVPDEEVNSAGARAAVRALPGIAERLGLRLEAAINLDAIADNGDGSYGRAVALGTVGKLLPSAFVVGRAVHASYAVRGVNAAALAGAIAAAVEWSPDLTEKTAGEVGSAPTLLGLRDSKTGYDVTTPESVWMFWNVATHRRGPEAVLETFGHLVREATGPLLAALRGRRLPGDDDAPPPPAEAPVLTYEALRAETKARTPDLDERLAAFAKAVAAEGLDLPEQCRRITEHLWGLSGKAGPAVVLGFASMPYLPTLLDGEPRARRLRAAVEKATRTVGDRHGAPIAVRGYFPGISDMSFLGDGDEASIPAVAANTPAWGAGISWPEGPALAGVPIVNAGPWGRDYHTMLERLHTPYAFRVLPELVADICERVLREADAE